MYKFEKLIVWQKSVNFLQDIYVLCGKLPKSERDITIDQIKRASLSVSLNIAEGSGAFQEVEFKRYLYIARKSLFEVIALLKIISVIFHQDNTTLLLKAEEIGKMLNSLITKIKNNKIDCVD